MNLIPEFEPSSVFLEPWAKPELIAWNSQVILMGILVCWASGIIGTFIVVRRMALMGDAISHSILPGIVFAFLAFGSLDVGPMFLGACLAGLACSFCIEWLQQNSPIKKDASMAMVFTTFFALGVTMINMQGGHLDLDTSCLLYGEIGLTPLAPNLMIAGNDLGNRSIWVMGIICLAIIFVVSLFYKQLLLTSFDAILAHSIGWSVKIIHLLLMMLLALSTVASLESVGVILVVAMLVFPSVTASFFFNRLSTILFCTFPLGIIYTFGGFHLAYWLDCSIAAAMAIMATVCFILGLVCGPNSYFLKFLITKKAPNV